MLSVQKRKEGETNRGKEKQTHREKCGIRTERGRDR
jgi:hypothetical protein